MKRFNKRKIGWILMGLATIGVFVFWWILGDRQMEAKCEEVEVRIYPKEDLFFVNRSRIMELMLDSIRQSPVGKSLKQLDLQYLEKRIKRHPSIRKANVYAHINGKVIAEVWQREPIIRIQRNGYTPFYLDTEGNEFPVSLSYTARVMVATGHIDSAVVRKLYTFARFVHENSFWKAQIEQIFVNDQSDLILVPKIGSSALIIGDTERLEEKLNDLEIIQRDALTAIGWQKYKSISVKYKDIVVCK